MPTGILNSTPAAEVICYYHTDHLGTPIMMTDANGNKVWEAEFMPFGEPVSVTGAITNNLRFFGGGKPGTHPLFLDIKVLSK